MSERFCVDCRHFQPNPHVADRPDLGTCGAAPRLSPDGDYLVSGKRSMPLHYYASNMRIGDFCGVEAKRWEKK